MTETKAEYSAGPCDAGISTIEQEFLASIALPNGITVSEWIAPQLEKAYENHEMPAMLPWTMAALPARTQKP